MFLNSVNFVDFNDIISRIWKVIRIRTAFLASSVRIVGSPAAAGWTEPIGMLLIFAAHVRAWISSPSSERNSTLQQLLYEFSRQPTQLIEWISVLFVILVMFFSHYCIHFIQQIKRMIYLKINTLNKSILLLLVPDVVNQDRGRIKKWGMSKWKDIANKHKQTNKRVCYWVTNGDIYIAVSVQTTPQLYTPYYINWGRTFTFSN